MENKEMVYEAPGKLEWHLRIAVEQGVWMSVSFTGGCYSAGSMHSARYATANPVVAMLIERSQEYKSGLIRKRR